MIFFDSPPHLPFAVLRDDGTSVALLSPVTERLFLFPPVPLPEPSRTFSISLITDEMSFHTVRWWVVSPLLLFIRLNVPVNISLPPQSCFGIDSSRLLHGDITVGSTR